MNCRAESQRAMRMYRNGDVKEAKELLVSVIRESRECEDAWVGLATCVDNIEHKKKCLREVIRINPHRNDVGRILTELEAQSVLLQSNIEEISTESLFDRKVITTNVAGVQYDGRPRAIRRLTLGQKLRLLRQPENPFDTNAINIQTEHKEDIGFVPKKLAADLAPYIDQNGVQLEASVLNLRIDTLGEKYQVEVCIDMDETLVQITNLYSIRESNREIQYFVDNFKSGIYLVFNSAESVRNEILEFLMRANIPYQNAGFCDRPSSDGNKYDHYVRFESNRIDLSNQLLDYIKSNFEQQPTVSQIEKKYKEDRERLEEQGMDLLEQLEEHQETIRLLTEEKKRIEYSNRTLASRASEDNGVVHENVFDLCKEFSERLKADRVLEVCSTYFSDRLIVLETALDSAKGINVYIGGLLFELIWKLVLDYRDQMRMPDTSNSPIDIFGAKIFSTHESDTTMNNKRARRERTFRYNDREILMTAHLKLGNNFRLYFDWLEDEQKIIIGYCGNHLYTP